MHRRSRRLAIAAAMFAVGSLAFAGCSGEPAAPKPDVSAIDFGADAAATPGNVELALGEPAWITKSGTEGSPAAAVSVLKIVKGDPKIYEEWDDGDQFAGTTPYYIVVQVSRLTDDQAEFAVYPVSDSGQPTEYVVNTFGSGDIAVGATSCPLTLPEPEEDSPTEITCVIGLAKNGEKITSALYNGGSYAGYDFAGSDAEYGTSPITWSADAKPGPIEYAAESVDLGAAGAATAPGSAVALGQPAWLPSPADATKIIGTSVLAVIPGDAAYFERYPNAADFAGLTPTFVVVQLQYPDDATAELRELPPLRPMQSDGEPAQWLKSSNPLASFGNGPGLQECGLVLPAYDAETRTYVGCIAALTPAGVSVDKVVYDGESYGAFFAQDALGYFSAPVTFQ